MATVDATLVPDDAVDILEEILPAQNRSFELGLRLKLPHHEVEGIHSTHIDPRSRLLHVILAFLNQAEPRPTWRVIVDALRSPAVKLPRLADKVEAAHFPDPTSTRGVVTETTSTASVQAASPSIVVVVDLPEKEEASTSTSVAGPPDTTGSPAATTTSDIAEDEVKSKQLEPSSGSESAVTSLRSQIKRLNRRFTAIKESTIKCLEQCCIAVKVVVFMLTSIITVDLHRAFLDERRKDLHECKDHWELFTLLNFHWNYLSYDMLDQLIDELTERDSSFEAIAREMVVYKKELVEFRKRTLLKLFCLAVPGTVATPPPGFRSMVTKHHWPDTVTLEDVEKFRIKFMQTFNLQQCAMIVEVIRANSFSITWFVLLSNTVITTLKKCTANAAVFRQYCVSVVEMDGVCIYQTPVQQEVPSASVESTTDIPSSETKSAAKKRITPTTIFSMVTRSLSRLSIGSIHEGQLTVQCYPKKRAPSRMIRGSATTNHQYAYFRSASSTSLYSYEWNTEQWKELPSCPYRNSALVIIDSELTTVGGVRTLRSGSDCTYKLFTLRQEQWVEEYPPMNAAQSDPAVVSTSDGDYIIVIGGLGATVELFQVKTRQWYELTNLPQPLTFPSAAICGNHVHVIGGNGNGYSCSLQALPSSDKPITAQLLPDLISWEPLPHLSLILSTAASLSGQLVIIGGKQGRSRINSIYQLLEGQWMKIGSITRGRWWCLSVSPSPDRVMIVGGAGAQYSVEECIVNVKFYS